MATYITTTGDVTGTLLNITGHLASYGIDLYSSNYDKITSVLTVTVSEPIVLSEATHLNLTLVE